MHGIALKKALLVGVFLVLSTLLSGCSSLALKTLNAVTRALADFNVVYDVAYGDKAWQQLDIYRPAGVFQSAKPVLVFFYGGGWTSGAKQDYLFVADAFTRLGYVVVLPDYVKYPQGHFPSFIEDGAEALAWVKQRISDYGGDSAQIVIAGHSAGAHLAAMLVADPSYLAEVGLKRSDINAMAGLAGPYNFTPTEEIYQKVFVSPDNYPAMQVANFIDGRQPPMWLAIAANDEVVGESNLAILEQKLRHTNAVYQTKTYEDRSHVTIVLALSRLLKGGATVIEDMDAFFKTVLGDTP